MHAKTFLATILAVATLAAGAAGPATAASPQDELVGGLAVGAPIPGALALADQTGKVRDFASLKGPRGLILIFTRSLDW